MYVDDIKLAGKTENIEPTWKILMEDVDLENPVPSKKTDRPHDRRLLSSDWRS